MKKNILVGSHVSIGGGLPHVFARGESIGCSALQMFVKSNRNWFDGPLTEEEIEAFTNASISSSISIKHIIAHSGYLINIGSRKPETEKNSVASLLHEVTRCEQLEIPFLVIHPGSHLGAGEQICISQIARNLDKILDRTQGTCFILLETMAGQGTNIGYTFEQLAAIRTLCEHRHKIGVCLDTCHIFAAGYDISTESGYESVIKRFDEIIGLDFLKAIHLNDSKGACASRVDRHAPLGDGHIPLSIFKLIMNDKRLMDIPKLLETPSDPEMLLWAKEIKLLKGMVE